MATHFAVLPEGIIDTVSSKLNGEALTGLQFLRLPHPRTGIPSLFLPHETQNSTTSSILEVQAISPPNDRSWFLNQEIVADGKLLMMTPVDPAFLLIPLLHAIQPEDGSSGTFRPSDDIFEESAIKLAAVSHSGLKDPTAVTTSAEILKFISMRCVISSLKRICDVKDITPEITVYRFSPSKLNEYLRSKVNRLCQPSSVIDESIVITRSLARDGLMENGKEAMLEAGRIKAACNLVGQYLPHGVQSALLASYDFSALDLHLKALADEAAAEALASAPIKAKKGKTKTEQEPKGGLKRKGSSHGVEQLKKANVNGMKKLSSFFTKK